MRRGGGKAKGSSFERKVCEKLSLWITQGQKADCLWRSAMSGGRATVARRKGKDVRQAGDVAAVAPEGHRLTSRYYVECKFYRDLKLNRFILGQGILAEFWRKTCKEAKHYKRAPMLIAKQNNMPTLVLLPGLSLFPGVIATVTFGRNTCSVYLFDELIQTDPGFARR